MGSDFNVLLRFVGKMELSSDIDVYIGEQGVEENIEYINNVGKEELSENDETEDADAEDVAMPEQQLYTTDNTIMDQHDFPYQCCIDITLPATLYNNSTTMAQQLQQILQVDPELTNQTCKVITTDQNHNVLRIHIYAKHGKGLRVSVSSILEYTQLAIKCYQEFA